MARKKPRGLGRRARMTTRVVRPFFRSLNKRGVFNVTVAGEEFVPLTGPVVVASNHPSIADPLVLWSALRRIDTVAIGKKSLWYWPVLGLLLRLLGHIPVKRGDRKSGKWVIKMASWVLQHGGLIIIYPEGGCSRDGQMRQFKRGVADLAFDTDLSGSDWKDIAVVPTAITGTEHVKPIGSWRIRRKHPVVLRYGAPLYASDFTTKEEFLDYLHLTILALLDQTYTG